MDTKTEIVQLKNHWLTSQVDVNYPTAESIQGRDLYLEKEKSACYVTKSVEVKTFDQDLIDDFYLVDFHRLTVMFAQLQSSYWDDPKAKAFALEFFAQIILSEEHPIYVGFKKGIPVICALVTLTKGDFLISDIVTDGAELEIKELFESMLAEKVYQETGMTEFISSL